MQPKFVTSLTMAGPRVCTVHKSSLFSLLSSKHIKKTMFVHMQSSLQVYILHLIQGLEMEIVYDNLNRTELS